MPLTTLSHYTRRTRSKRISRFVWFVVGALASLAGCQSAHVTQRPLDDIFQDSLQYATVHAQQTRERSLAAANQPAMAGGVIPAAFLRDDFERTGQDSRPRNVRDEPLHASGPLVNEIFEETDIREAIQSLASQAQVRVIVDEQVAGITTVLIEDEPFESALQRILLPLGYIWARSGNQYMIGTSDPESSLFRYLSQKIDYRPKHFAPNDLLPLLPESLRKYVRVVEKRNLMVIQAPNDICTEILEELDSADQPVAQVVLEAMVAVHAPESSYQFGMDLKQLMTDAASNGANVNLSGLAFSGAITPASLGSLFGDFGMTSYFLRVLEKEGYLKIQAAPHVMAKNGEKATISINRETFFSNTPPNSANVFYSQTIQKVEAGIVLNITPIIRGENVTVQIERAEVSEDIRESGSADLANPYPLINRRFVTTTVDVKDGETIVIGGLSYHQTVDRVNRIPWLSKLWGVGKFFQQIDQQEKEAEVTVFISPRIVRPNHSEVIPIPLPADMERTPLPLPSDMERTPRPLPSGREP
ncbi:MAG: type II and III secretion system protein [Planctomycetota bacterium]